MAEIWADNIVDNGLVQLGGEDNTVQGRLDGGVQREAINRDNEDLVIEDRIDEDNLGEASEEDERVEIPKKIRWMAWNSEGLFEKLSLNGVCEYINSFDIVCLGETFTFSSFDFSIKFGDYIPLHSSAKKFNIRGRPSGGLVVLVRKSLERFITIIETKISHVLCFKIAKNLLNTTKDILFIGTYVHPSESIFYSDEDHDCTLEAVEQFMLDQLEDEEECQYILAGDLNARIGDWGLKVGEVEEEGEEDTEEIERSSQDGVINENGHKLIQICTAFNTTPINGIKQKGFDDNYTFIGRRGNSTIDHFVCSADLLDNIHSYTTGSRVESQHMPVEMEMGNNQDNQVGDRQTGEREVTTVKWKEAKREECLNIMNKPSTARKIEEATGLLDDSLEEGLDKFDQIMKEINKPMKNSFKYSDDKIPKKKWFDRDCEKKKKEARQALLAMNKINGIKKAEEHKRAKDKYLDSRLEYQKLIREKRKQYKRDMQDKLVNSRNDARTFWGEIRKISYRRQKQANISIERWGEHFNQVFNPEGETLEGGIEEAIEGERGIEEHRPREERGEVGRREIIEDEDLDGEITREEIIGGIDRQKNGKAGGLDEVSAELLQLTKGKLLEFLIKLFNIMFDTSTFPLRWAKAIVVPLHKKGDINNPDHYRGISLLSITSKVFTGIMNRRLYNWAEDHDKINIEQAGFRKSHSTIDHIFTLHSLISNCLFGRKRSKVYVCFVDFKKAFDTVKRDKLWEVLDRQGISDKMLRMVKAIYDRVVAVVRYGGEVTGEINCPQGVRQGCQLSPLLFTLLITELAQEVALGGRHGYQFNPGMIELFTLLFADDIALIATTPAGLQNQINILKRGAERLGLVVNLEKTKCMVFRKGGFLGRLERWFYGEERIEVVNKYKYLGYTLTTKLSVDIALSEYAGKAKGRVVSIFRALYKLGKIDIGIFFKLFDSQVKSILLYGAEIWGMRKREVIEKVHLYACKKLLGVSTKTPNSFVYTELNRYPLYVDARVRVMKYWAKLLQMDEGRLPKQAYIRELRELNKEKGWGLMIQEHLTINGFGNIWLDQERGVTTSFCKEFKQREIDIFWQEEHRGMEESRSRRFVNYLSYKEGHERELYLGDIRVPKFRKALTRLRFGINELRGNRKYINPQAIRICPFCTYEETDYHFLVKCAMYRELRTKYISKYWITLNNVSVGDLVNNNNLEIVRGTAAFIYYALQLRGRH